MVTLILLPNYKGTVKQFVFKLISTLFIDSLIISLITYLILF